MNTTDAAYNTVHDFGGGSESLGPRVGISPAVLRNKVNISIRREEKRHHLTFDEAQRVVAMTGDVRMLQAWAHAEGYLLVKAPEGGEAECDMSVFEKYAGMGVANGAFSQTIYTSLADGGISPEEMKLIEAAGLEFMTKIVEIKQRLRGMVG